MSNCFEFFCKKITKKSGSDVVGFIEKITDSMLFTKIIVDNNLNAYKVLFCDDCTPLFIHIIKFTLINGPLIVIGNL
jgi:hypothetical protein